MDPRPDPDPEAAPLTTNPSGQAGIAVEHVGVAAEHAHPPSTLVAGRRPTPPWLFMLVMIPVGAVQGHSAVALPYLLRQHYGVSMEQISALVGLTLLPHSFKFFWAPLLDTLIRRKYWHLWTSVVASIGTLLAFLLPVSGHYRALSMLLVLVNIASATSSSALGSLCATTVHPRHKGVASGYYTMGSLASAGLMGWLMLSLAEPPPLLRRFYAPFSMGSIGVLVSGIMLTTTFLALVIDEPPPQARRLWGLLKAILRDTWSTLRSRAGWTGLLICMSPVGTAAASNIFGGMAQDYHASVGDVQIATGLIAGLANAAGAILGGWLADRVNRRAAYFMGGATTAACAIALALSPATRGYYMFWTLAYAVASGLAYAAFYAFVFEMIGPTEGASTKYGLFIGIANLAIAYVTYLDGLVYDRGAQLHLPSGRVGLLLCDAGLNILGICVLGCLTYYLKRRPLRLSPEPTPAPAPEPA